MSGSRVDTDVLSAIMRKERHPAVQSWYNEYFHRRDRYLSSITFGEIRYGLLHLPEGAKRRELEREFETHVVTRFRSRMLPVTAAIAERWASFRDLRDRQGRPLSATDGLIAATAFEHNLTMVTGNVKDFQDLGLTIVNPFEFER
ncbi:MAG: type II toxin-antitoxin system VapC family toxin [Acidobacteria bacterium]|nr:type II toxin-antitoxin system VapC family toxin [Acidobacteriota bacterium]